MCRGKVMGSMLHVLFELTVFHQERVALCQWNSEDRAGLETWHGVGN